MQPTDADAPELIAQAVAKTQKLLELLHAAAEEGAQPSPGLSPEASRAGAQAVQKALDAAASTLAALRSAQSDSPAADDNTTDPKRADAL